MGDGCIRSCVPGVTCHVCCDELRDMFVMLQLTWKTFDP